MSSALVTQCFIPEEKASDGNIVAWTTVDAVTHIVGSNNKTCCGVPISDFQAGWIGGSIHRKPTCPRCLKEDVWTLQVTWQSTATVTIPKSAYPTIGKAIAHAESGECPLPVLGDHLPDSIKVISNEDVNQPQPCPFCGSFDIEPVETPTTDTETNMGYGVTFMCNCGTQGPSGLDKASALERWNKRI